jgi:hypothetical protein
MIPENQNPRYILPVRRIEAALAAPVGEERGCVWAIGRKYNLRQSRPDFFI